ncbi:MAG: hypothetical protein BWY82_02067 [Verrucomicrobia bacterium ADurb.Bin474]|nr:MAG: hypothetical protein BWY82_02067 [Verrucomicrobia bacterium ADurb.Bin474]
MHVAHFLDIENHVTGILLHGVVHRTIRQCPRAIIVNCESAAHIQVSHRKSHQPKLTIELGGFDQSTFDRADIRNLAPHMKMQQSQAILKSVSLQILAHPDHFHRVESELRVFS